MALGQITIPSFQVPSFSSSSVAHVLPALETRWLAKGSGILMRLACIQVHTSSYLGVEYHLSTDAKACRDLACYR